MHIETELDDIHAERLLEIQRQSGKPLPDLISEILAKALDTPNSDDTEASPWYRAFTKAGLLGCVSTDLQLASTYKEKLDFSASYPSRNVGQEIPARPTPIPSVNG